MKPVTNEEIDQAILAFLKSKSRWQKVAMTVVMAAKSLEGESLEGDQFYHLVHERILALVEAGSLEGKGDLNQWRFSEVRVTC